MYRQRITKRSVLTFWRRELCRTAVLHFVEEMQTHDILTYKFTLGPDAYDRKPNNETDCYKGAYGELPDGMFDISKCYGGKRSTLCILSRSGELQVVRLVQ